MWHDKKLTYIERGRFLTITNTPFNTRLLFKGDINDIIRRVNDSSNKQVFAKDNPKRCEWGAKINWL